MYLVEVDVVAIEHSPGETWTTKRAWWLVEVVGVDEIPPKVSNANDVQTNVVILGMSIVSNLAQERWNWSLEWNVTTKTVNGVG